MAYDGLGGASAAAAAASSRSCAEPLAEWPRNSRVAANSPSLCPTMFSVMYTGMNLFPLCTARVWPTKSGVMVERRDQVLRSEEHTSELQSRENLVCRLLLEKKNANPHFRCVHIRPRPTRSPP